MAERSLCSLASAGAADDGHAQSRLRASPVPVRFRVPRHLADIARQDRREVGVDHGGVAAADKLDQRRDLVADGDLREADLAADLGNGLLVLGKFPGVHEDDGDGVDAVALGLLDQPA